ncbi:MAG: ThuA domain-containing protein [Clostridia bacterium]|nr:ThuA domain-containing protein [Clostridia bacterium]
MAKIKVTIWNEFYHEKVNDRVKSIYPEGMHACLKEGLACDDFEIRLADLDMPEHGLTEEVLNDTDVLLWWGHCRHDAVSDEVANRVVAHVRNGMGFIPLHSAHYSKPFTRLMGSTCSLYWREVNEHARVWCVNPAHPIAQGLPQQFVIDHEECYGEPFGIPQPDDIVFITWFAGGDVFRGGCTFTRDRGKIFYFHPGHETFPNYKNEYVLKVISNAIRWAAPAPAMPDRGNDYRNPLEPVND